MPEFYKRYVGPTLATRLAEMSESSKNLLDLSEEISVARIAACESVRLFDLVLSDTEGKVTNETKMLAQATVRRSLTHVAQLCEKAARIQALTERLSLTPTQIGWIAVQMTKVLKKHVDDEAVITKVMEDLQEITMPADKRFDPKVTLALD